MEQNQDQPEPRSALLAAPAAMAAPSIIGPFGEPLTRDMLPQAPPRRWKRRRQVEIAAAVTGGLMSRTEVLNQYHITHEQFDQWISLLHQLNT